MYRVRSGATTGMAKLVQDLGGNPVELIERVGLSPAQFRDPDTYIPYPKLAEMLELGARSCRAPLFGLQLAERQTSNVLGGLALAVSGAATVREAMATAGKYLYLHAAGIRLEQQVAGDDVRLTLILDIHSELGTDQLMQLSIGHLATLISDLLDIDRFSLPLYLQQARPAGVQGVMPGTRFRRLRYDQVFDGIVLRQHQLERTIRQDAELLRKHFEDYVLELQHRYPDSLEERVREVIGHLLPAGECSIERVAATLDMHPRTLQTRLSDQNMNYRQILQETRYDLARRQLREGNTNITDLALQLGYAEIAVFSRHFKRWSGMSPRAWQKSQRSMN